MSSSPSVGSYVNVALGAFPSSSRWTWLVLLLVQITVASLVFRTWVGPILLRLISKRVRIKSISPRSIRGLYIRTGVSTIRVHRIGLSYHSPSQESARQFSVKVEGLRWEVRQLQAEGISRKTEAALKNVGRVGFARSVLANALWWWYSALYAFLEPYVRPVVRTIFVTLFRLVIRCLPALTQVLDFEMDSAELHFPFLSGAHIVFKDVTIYTRVQFTQVERVLPLEPVQAPRARQHRRFIGMAHLKDRFTGSVRRSWDRAWGKTSGSASLVLHIRQIAACAAHNNEPNATRDSPVTPSSPQSFEEAEHAAHTFLSLEDPLSFMTSLDFSPRRGMIRKHSVATSLNLPAIHLKTHKLLPLLLLLREHLSHREPALPTSPLFSATPTPSTPQIVSPRSPSSPFFGRLSGAMKFTNRQKQLLKQRPASISLWALMRSIQVNCEGIVVDHSILAGHFNTVDFSLRVGTINSHLCLGDPACREFNEEYAGPANADPGDGRPSDFRFQLEIEGAVLSRQHGQKGVPREILSCDPIVFQAIVSQWPNSSTGGAYPRDPNSSVVACSITLDGIRATEYADFLEDFSSYSEEISDVTSADPPQPNFPQAKTTILPSIPRISLQAQIRSIKLRIRAEHGELRPFVCHADTDGLQMSLSSEFRQSCVDGLSGTYFQIGEDGIPTVLETSMKMVLHPVFVRMVPSAVDHHGENDENIPGDQTTEPLISLSSMEVDGNGRVNGVQLDDSSGGVSVDLSTAVLDMQCVADALKVSLWQPFVVNSLSDTLRLFANFSAHGPPRSVAQAPPASPLIGLSVRFRIAQVSMIVTSKDVNPDDDLGLSRGIALRSGLSIEYCSVHDAHTATTPPSFVPDENRPHLSLPEEFPVISAKRQSRHSLRPGSFRCVLRRTTMRTAVSTDFAADELYTSEDDPDVKVKEFLWIPNMTLDMASTTAGHRELVLNISDIRVSFSLLHAYCILLSMKCLQEKLLPPSTLPKPKRGQHPHSSFTCSIGTVDLLCNLPLKEKLSLQAAGISLRLPESKRVSVSWRTILLCVPSLRPSEEHKWEQVAQLKSWNIAISTMVSGQPSLMVEGDAANIRLPHKYMVCDLILAISVTIKALKHMASIIHEGSFRPIGEPFAEDAKTVPVMGFQLKHFTIAASDDPFETKLGVVWRAGIDAAKTRVEREEAFQDKVNTIIASEHPGVQFLPGEHRFGPEHSVAIGEARRRLDQVHAISWMACYREYAKEQHRRESVILKETSLIREDFSDFGTFPKIEILPPIKTPPLFRLIFEGVSMNLSPPSFSTYDLAEFMHDVGKGLPRDTLFSLLIPIHIDVCMQSAEITLRDYPLPLLNIPRCKGDASDSWEFTTDLVIAEELGTATCVLWQECNVVPQDCAVTGAPALSLRVPKTTMPVKTYACPIIHVKTTRTTSFCWCVSYSAALQDVMRVFDTLTPPPPDPSPALGFWDKLRLIFHWRVRVKFASDVQLNLKGSRDPYAVDGAGAGFSFCWNGNTELMVGHANKARELLQVTSDVLHLVIPNLWYSEVEESVHSKSSSRGSTSSRDLNQGRYQKIVAKFTSGIRFGIGVVLERTCGPNCATCHGIGSCRLFDFAPHYTVVTCPKSRVPTEKAPEDSYRNFRSDFIHFSTSLVTTFEPFTRVEGSGANSFHLTPKTFANFWSWWDLFDRSLSLPVRQGRLFPSLRPPSKKFGKHLATLKYRLSISKLFISHVYIDDSREAWKEGITHFVGVKALVDLFEADMHQREQEAIIPGLQPGSTKRIRHKPFYAAEVTLNGIDLRAQVATYGEPLKSAIPVECDASARRHNIYTDVVPPSEDAFWIDLDDFVETDWNLPNVKPDLRLIHLASCPQFTYFRHISMQPASGESHTVLERSRFGTEDTHPCSMGKEKSVHEVQIDIVSERIGELEAELLQLGRRDSVNKNKDRAKPEHLVDNVNALRKRIALLRRYADQLRKFDLRQSESQRPSTSSHHVQYLVPSDLFNPSDWAGFDNVYQVHCPKLVVSNITRDILMQYYFCSRSRRGFEYRMATRAVKFIRDQAEAILLSDKSDEKTRRSWNPAGGAQAAANVLRKIIGVEDAPKSPEVGVHSAADVLKAVDPLSGWSDGVTLKRGHFCLLLKPQVVLRSVTDDSICVLAAIQATLQSFAILDEANVQDPISGRIMSRSYAVLNGMQTFSPSLTKDSKTSRGWIPLETLLDLRFECDDVDRLVPQTDATLQYDKFNRLRLRNNVVSHSSISSKGDHSHLRNQSDLVDVRVPRFTVTANSKNFACISSIVTDLLLFSDSAHKLHLNKVETLLFKYDFTDLASAAGVVTDLQYQLRKAVEMESYLHSYVGQSTPNLEKEIMKNRAHIFLLADKLNLIFDAIKLAQDKIDDGRNEEKSALRVHASSSEISWGMVDDRRELILKLAVRGIDFSWLSQQDSSTLNKLEIVDLQAFDGSPDAEWPEILSKYHEPTNHPLIKRGLFVSANWKVLAPVGGIGIYEHFTLDLHPMRLQLEARVGKSVMEYLWPARRSRANAQALVAPETTFKVPNSRYSSDSPRNSPTKIQFPKRSRHSGEQTPVEEARLKPAAPRRLLSSRSMNDLKQRRRTESLPRIQHRTNSMDGRDVELAMDLTINTAVEADTTVTVMSPDEITAAMTVPREESGDAAEMKSRSAQKTFIFVRISSVHLLLSIRMEESFFCRDARIRTRELEYRNRTLSFEELADQFIPSDPSWKGWVRMAFHQPLVPVLPVARELISKTKWVASRKRKDNKGSKKPALAIESGEPSGSSSPNKLVKKGPVGYLKRRKTQTTAESSAPQSTTGTPVRRGILSGRSSQEDPN